MRRRGKDLEFTPLDALNLISDRGNSPAFFAAETVAPTPLLVEPASIFDLIPPRPNEPPAPT